MLKKLFPLLLLLFLAGAAMAQEEVQAPVRDFDDEIYEDTVTSVISSYDELQQNENNYLPTDTTEHTHFVSIHADSIQNWKVHPKYNAIRNLDSLLKDWQKKETKDMEVSKPSHSFSFFNSNIIRMILWFLAILFVGYIVYKLVLNKGIFTREPKSLQVDENLTEDERFLQQDFDALIHQAYKMGDLRLAVRYQFLKTLEVLNGRSLISFSIDKTNMKYYYELPELYKPEFLQLTKYYEYVWYGHLPATKEMYEPIGKAFNEFLKKV